MRAAKRLLAILSGGVEVQPCYSGLHHLSFPSFLMSLGQLIHPGSLPGFCAACWLCLFFIIICGSSVGADGGEFPLWVGDKRSHSACFLSRVIHVNLIRLLRQTAGQLKKSNFETQLGRSRRPLEELYQRAEGVAGRSRQRMLSRIRGSS